ncbi:MAG: ABC transporter ATP-binding protein [Limnochordia bacterium]|jgi:ATP-binding cassette subfamily B protein|nr:ABC transporter ATP-binding protein/permease [Limnochordia bacterium]MDD2629524.1 ABC transporter ATP-binding protein [Limnochordia bacterium]MDD4517621.1 ABC transporter ATP-binding protein [Limnochordia bacterium]
MAAPKLKHRLIPNEKTVDCTNEDQFSHILNFSESLISHCTTDLSIEGQYIEGAILLTKERLIVTKKKEDVHTVVMELPLEEIGELQVRHMYGNGMLEAKTMDTTMSVARFSRTCAKEVDALAAAFNRLGQDPNTLAEETVARKSSRNEEELTRCPACGRALPPGSDICLHCVDKRKTFRRLMHFAKPYKLQVVFLILLVLGITALQLVPPILTRTLIDQVFPNKDLDLLMKTILILVLTHVSINVFSAIRIRLSGWLGQHIIFDLRTAIYDHLQRLNLSYFEKRPTGAIMSRVTSDTNQLQHFIVQVLPQTVVNITTLVGIGIVLFTMNPRLALLALLPAPIVAILTLIFTRRLRNVYRRVWRRFSDLNALLGDTIPGIRIVKAFTTEEIESARFAEQSDELMQQHIHAVRFESIFYPGISMVMTIGVILVWLVGGRQLILDPESAISAGTLIAFINYMWHFYGPVQALCNLSSMIQQAVTSSERVFEVLDTQPETHSSGGKHIERLEGHIEFRHVHFRYETDEEVLKDINLEIKAGEMIGLVGSSGAGKSTIASLVPRFYDVTDGQVLIDGHDVRDLNLRSLRAQIGIVTQEPFLFTGTIAENISYGLPDVSLEQIIVAAKAANAHNFIMEFTDAYDTVVGERGTGLSGGQKQRVSIARAILKNPRILILDEATSAVDTETEKLIQEAIDNLVANRTTLAIAHRLSTLKNADRIVVVENGRIVEIGTHEELLAQNGIFSRLWHLQTEVSKMKAV